MSLAKRILLSAALGIGLLLLGAAVFRKPLVHGLVHWYLKSLGIAAEFVTDEVRWNRIAFSEIRIEDSRIPRLVIERSSESQAPLGLSRIDLLAERLDVKSLIGLSTRGSEKSAQSDSLDLKRLCNVLLPLEWSVKVNRFAWEGEEFPVEGGFTHRREDLNFRFSLNGKGAHPSAATRSNLTVIKSIRGFDFDVRASLSCASDRVEALLEALRIEIDSLDSPVLTVKSTSLRGDGREFKVDLTDLNQPKPMRPFGFFIRAETRTGELAEARAEIDLAKKKLDLRGLRLKALPWVDIRDWSLSGSYDFVENGRIFAVDLSDKKGAVRFNGVQWRQTSSEMNVFFPHRNPSVLVFGESLIGYFPKLSDWIEKAEGKLEITGGVSRVAGDGKEESTWKGPLRARGAGIGLKTAYGSVSDGELDLTAASVWPLRSPEGQKLFVREVSIGRAIHDVEWKFEIASLDLIRFESMRATYAGSDWKVSPFEIERTKPGVRGFNAQVTAFPLEELLKLALKESVQADGKLSGTLAFDYVNGAPSVNGGFTTDSPGWVRYRPGGRPASLIRFSDGPMEILNAYLYDFHFDSMGIEVKTNAKYDLLTRLNALGKNPAYLRQKPLKLSLGVEQNLLSTIRSLMLTYDLPEKLKEHFEKLEAE